MRGFGYVLDNLCVDMAHFGKLLQMHWAAVHVCTGVEDNDVTLGGRYLDDDRRSLYVR